MTDASRRRSAFNHPVKADILPLVDFVFRQVIPPALHQPSGTGGRPYPRFIGFEGEQDRTMAWRRLYTEYFR